MIKTCLWAAVLAVLIARGSAAAGPSAKPVERPVAISEEAERRMARGAAAIADAKTSADFLAAAKEFELATIAAPEWGDAYYNLGVAYDKAGKPIEALAALKRAAAAMPEARDVKTLMYQVEFRAEKARDPLIALAGDWYQIDYPKETKADIATYWNRVMQRWSLKPDGSSGALWVSHRYWDSKISTVPVAESDPVLTARVVNGSVVWEGLSRYGECHAEHRAPAQVTVKENGTVLDIRLAVLSPSRVMQIEGHNMRRIGASFHEFNSACVIIKNFQYVLGRGE